MRVAPAETQSTYDEWAGAYETDVRSWGYDAPEFVARMLSAHAWRLGMPADDVRVLDAGAGSGLLGRALAEVNFSKHITATDLSAEILRLAEGTCVYERTEVADLNEGLTAFAAGEFDAVGCVGVLTYLDPGRTPCALDELVRVTRAGGLIAYTGRTDRLHEWAPVESRLSDARAWEVLEVSPPLAYLPGHAEYADKIQCVVTVCQVL